uniref:Diguanylate cyclase n=1 Tax=Dictyoglomus thermophilum TaxID=14 RepID=A0A7C3MIE7_DICTH
MNELFLSSLITWLEEYSIWGIFITDTNFKVIFWNKWLEVNTGIKKENIIGQNIFEVLPEIKKFESYFQQVLQGSSVILSQKFHKYLIPIEIKDKEYKYMQQTVQMFPLLEGNVEKGIIAIIEDVTDRVKREENYKKQIRSLKILNDIQKSIFTLDREELLDKLFEGAIKISNTPFVYLFLIKDGNFLLKKSTKNVLDYSKDLESPSCILKKVLSERRTIYIPYTKETDMKCVNPVSNSVLAVPILGKEKVLGILVLESLERNSFKQDDILNLETLTMQAAIIFENIELLEALRESEARYRVLAEQSLTGVSLLQDNKFIYTNSRFVEILGYPPRLETLNDFTKYVYEEDKNRFLERYNQILENTFEYIIDEIRIRKINNEIAYLEISMVNVLYKGKKSILLSILDITYRKKLEEELKLLSITDALTGLYNRRGFMTLAEHTFSIANRLNKKIIVMFIDLDHMKEINDKYGHQVGDQALIDLANILRETLRQNDLIARFGGDEFVIMGIIGEENHKEIVLKRLLEKIEEFNSKQDRPYKISISIGIVTYDPKNPVSLEDLLQKADEIMYEQKRIKKEKLKG